MCTLCKLLFYLGKENTKIYILFHVTNYVAYNSTTKGELFHQGIGQILFSSVPQRANLKSEKAHYTLILEGGP